MSRRREISDPPIGPRSAWGHSADSTTTALGIFGTLSRQSSLSDPLERCAENTAAASTPNITDIRVAWKFPRQCFIRQISDYPWLFHVDPPEIDVVSGNRWIPSCCRSAARPMGPMGRGCPARFVVVSTTLKVRESPPPLECGNFLGF